MDARWFSCISALVAALVLARPAHAAIIQDDVFDNADWTLVELIDTSANQSAVFVGEQAVTGGNPDQYRRVVNEVNEAGPAGINIVAGHVYGPGSFDPSVAGAIDAVQFMIDGLGVSGPAGAMGFNALILQDGFFYLAPMAQVLNGDGWQPRDSGLLSASAFGLVVGGISVDLGQNPDFSGSGSEMLFGLATRNGTFGTPSTNEGGFDNWVVTITEVPEPGVAVLLALAAAAVVARRRGQV